MTDYVRFDAAALDALPERDRYHEAGAAIEQARGTVSETSAYRHAVVAAMVEARPGHGGRTEVAGLLGIPLATVSDHLRKHRESIVETCTVCGHGHRRPITPAQHGMCSQCHKRVRHTDDGTGHTLCEGRPLTGWAPAPGEERPDCPSCAHAAATGDDPIRLSDLKLLQHTAEQHPMYDHWTSENYRQMLWEAGHGRRLEREGFLDLSGDHPVPTDRGRELLAAYLRPTERTSAHPHLAVAAALRAVE